MTYGELNARTQVNQCSLGLVCIDSACELSLKSILRQTFCRARTEGSIMVDYRASTGLTDHQSMALKEGKRTESDAKKHK